MRKQVFFILFAVFMLSACNLPAAPVQEAVPAQPAEKAVLLFSIGMHIEPQGTTHQGIKSGKSDYSDPAYFNRQVQDILAVTNLVAAHQGRMTIQAQSPFTDAAIANQNSLLADLAASGNELALHFHEDAHLGKDSSSRTVQEWCDVMKEEIALIEQAAALPQGGASPIRYWSGGNLFPEIDAAAACAGLSINSDWKNPQTQTTDLSLVGLNPWRPAGGTDGSDFSQISAHNPSGQIIFLPEGLYDKNNFASMRRSDTAGGDEAYFEYLKQSLLASVTAAQAGKVNVFHFTVHPGEFRGERSAPYAVIEKFLTEVVDPLVASGQVQWATFGEMADACAAWEQTHPGLDPRK